MDVGPRAVRMEPDEPSPPERAKRVGELGAAHSRNAVIETVEHVEGAETRYFLVGHLAIEQPHYLQNLQLRSVREPCDILVHDRGGVTPVVRDHTRKTGLVPQPHIAIEYGLQIAAEQLKRKGVVTNFLSQAAQLMRFAANSPASQDFDTLGSRQLRYRHEPAGLSNIRIDVNDGQSAGDDQHARVERCQFTQEHLHHTLAKGPFQGAWWMLKSFKAVKNQKCTTALESTGRFATPLPSGRKSAALDTEEPDDSIEELIRSRPLLAIGLTIEAPGEDKVGTMILICGHLGQPIGDNRRLARAAPTADSNNIDLSGQPGPCQQFRLSSPSDHVGRRSRKSPHIDTGATLFVINALAPPAREGRRRLLQWH